MHAASCLCCRSSRAASPASSVSLCGWLQSIRVIGDLLFAVLRDHSGSIQLVWTEAEAATAAAASSSPSIFPQLASLPVESVVAVKGRLQPRPPSMVNPSSPSGAFEVKLSSLYILSPAAPSLPLTPLTSPLPAESVRLSHRHLDLRRPYLQRLLRLRSRIAHSVRAFLSSPPQSFIEVETPSLFLSSPEGAREFLVPSRSSPSLFYALPQSPQQYKQMLMVGGVDRYYQLARCWRDEGGRSDRQLEFTQVDLEMSFVTQRDVRQLAEAVLSTAISETRTQQQQQSEQQVTAASSLPSMTYRDAMDGFGTDKPDLRFALRLHDVTELVGDEGDDPLSVAVRAGGVVKAIRVPALSPLLSRKELDALQSLEPAVSFVRVDSQADWKAAGWCRSLLDRKRLHEPLRQLLSLRDGDLLLLSGGGWRSVCERMGRARLMMKEELQRRGQLRLRADELQLLWVTDFPLFDMDVDELHRRQQEQQRPQGGEQAGAAAFIEREKAGLTAMHHPFTAPHPDDLPALLSLLSSLLSSSSSSTAAPSALPVSGLQALSRIRGQHYDLVCNGVELAGGSIRIHSASLQTDVLRLLLPPPPSSLSPFRALLTALSHGAPPHGGIAIGFDRLVAMLGACVEEREGRGGGLGECLPIRDVIAFPKSSGGRDLLFGAPAAVSDEQLADYHIQIRQQSSKAAAADSQSK